MVWERFARLRIMERHCVYSLWSGEQLYLLSVVLVRRLQHIGRQILPFLLVYWRPYYVNPNFQLSSNGENPFHSGDIVIARNLFNGCELCHWNSNSFYSDRRNHGIHRLSIITLWVFGCAFYRVFHSGPSGQESVYFNIQKMAVENKQRSDIIQNENTL